MEDYQRLINTFYLGLKEIAGEVEKDTNEQKAVTITELSVRYSGYFVNIMVYDKHKDDTPPFYRMHFYKHINGVFKKVRLKSLDEFKQFKPIEQVCDECIRQEKIMRQIEADYDEQD